MSKQLSPIEKEFLVKRYLANPDNKISEFARVNGVSETSIKKWVQIYKNEGIEGFTKGNETYKILPEGTDETTENYKREIIKLRIENERLKKNYTVKENPDGTITYIHLKEKSMR